MNKNAKLKGVIEKFLSGGSGPNAFQHGKNGVIPKKSNAGRKRK